MKRVLCRHGWRLASSPLVLAVLAVILVSLPAVPPVGGQDTRVTQAQTSQPAAAELESPSAMALVLRRYRAGQPTTVAPAAAPRTVSQPSGVGPAGFGPAVDHLVNDPSRDTGDRTTQSETSLAKHRLGNTICAGYNRAPAAAGTPPTGGYSGLSRSPDRGVTWVDLGGIGQFGDPVLAIHERTGVFFYAQLAAIGGNPAIGVARSTDDCHSFGAAVDASPIASGLPHTTDNDKPWIAVDNTRGPRDGNIYVCWTRFFADTSELRFSRSTDGGASYGNEQILQAAGTGPFGCHVDVGPGGEVYVVWADRVGQFDIRFRRSLDGGVSFEAPVTVATGNRHPGIDRIRSCDANRGTLNGDIRMLHQAWMAVDTTGGPFAGNIYVVWASDPPGAVDNSDVFFSRSTNGGLTWSPRVQLSADAGLTDQFEPFVAVGIEGTLAMAWYDRRLDPVNNLLIDVFKAFSTDGGATFGPPTRLTDVSFPPPHINPNFDPAIVECYMGEYIAIVGDAHAFYFAWGDNRGSVTTPGFPHSRPDPDVRAEVQRIRAEPPRDRDSRDRQPR